MPARQAPVRQQAERQYLLTVRSCTPAPTLPGRSSTCDLSVGPSRLMTAAPAKRHSNLAARSFLGRSGVPLGVVVLIQRLRLQSVRSLAEAHRSCRLVCGAGAVFAVVAPPNLHALQGICHPSPRASQARGHGFETRSPLSIVGHLWRSGAESDAPALAHWEGQGLEQVRGRTGIPSVSAGRLAVEAEPPSNGFGVTPFSPPP